MYCEQDMPAIAQHDQHSGCILGLDLENAGVWNLH